MVGEPGKLRHLVTDLFARQPQLVEGLKVEPEFRAGAKPVAESQRRIGRDAALPVDDSCYTVHRHVDLPGQLGSRDAEFLELLRKMLTRVNGGSRHECLLVIVCYLDINRPWGAARPREANPPLVIDADAVLAPPVALEDLQPVAGQCG
jgi:hypothetical protein